MRIVQNADVGSWRSIVGSFQPSAYSNSSAGWSRCLFFTLILFIPKQGEQNATRSRFARIKFICHGKRMNKGLAHCPQLFQLRGIGAAKASSRAHPIT
jgi:hypothetical protein